MAAFGDPVTERFLCSICLDVFIDPVCTPCGHNFCQTCLKTYWDTNQNFICPNCNERFSPRPDLKINTTLRDLVLYNKSELLEMMGQNQKAAEKHDKELIKEMEQEITELKKRNTELQMMEKKQKVEEKQYEDVIKDLKKEITELGNRNTELEMIVVYQKAEDEQYENLIKDLKRELTELRRKNIEQEMIVVNLRAAEIQHENLIKALSQENAHLRKKNTELKMMETNQKAAEKHYENLIKDLEQDISELKDRNIEKEMKIVNHKVAETHYENLTNGLAQENCKLRIKNFELEMMEKKRKTAEKQSEDIIKDLKRRNTELEMMEKKQKTAEKQSEDIIKDLKRRNTELEMMEKKQKTAEKQSEDVIKDLKRRNTELEVKISHTENNLRLQEIHQQQLRQQQKSSPESCMWWIIVVIVGSILLAGFVKNHNIRQHNEAEWKCMKQNAVDVTLDPDTAHPNLILSYDKKQVRYGDTARSLPNYSKRFDNYLNVLGNEGFSSGRFYYEVQVKGKTGWVLGVARESSYRKGEITLAPVNGYWTVSMNGNKYLAYAGPALYLSLSVNLQKVGVFVDYKKGLVSFYDVDSRSHIYSFTGQTFTEKLYPVFNPYNNKDPLIITPVNYNE